MKCSMVPPRCMQRAFQLVVILLSGFTLSAEIDPSKTVLLGNSKLPLGSNFTISLLLRDADGNTLTVLATPYPTIFLIYPAEADQNGQIRYSSVQTFDKGILNSSFSAIEKSGQWSLQILVSDTWPIANITLDPLQFSSQHSLLFNRATVRAGVTGFLVLRSRDILGNPTSLLLNVQNAQIVVTLYCSPGLDGFCSNLSPILSFGSWLSMPDSNGQYEMAYSTTRSGLYTVQLTFDDATSSGRTMFSNITIMANTPAPQTMVVEDLPDVSTAGIQTNFSVQGRDEYGNNLTSFWTDDGKETQSLIACIPESARCVILSRLNAIGQKSSPILPAPLIYLVRNGRVMSGFRLTQSGSYSLEILLRSLLANGSSITQAIRSSPYLFSLNADESGQDTRVSFSPNSSSLTLVAGQAIVLNLTEYDRFGNQRTSARSDFALSLTAIGTTYSPTFNVSTLYGGLYIISAIVTIAGNYSIQCRINVNVPVPSSSFRLQVFSADLSAEGTRIVVSYDARTGSVDSINAFEIESGDRFQNRIFSGGMDNLIGFNVTACIDPRKPCSSSNLSSHTALSHIRDLGGGYYELSYSTTVGGWYSASIQVAGALIRVDGVALPFSILVDAGFTDAGNSVAFASEDFACADAIMDSSMIPKILSCSNAGSDAKLRVQIKDKFGNWRIAQRQYTFVRFYVQSVKVLAIDNATFDRPLWNEKIELIVKDKAGIQRGQTSTDPGTFDISFLTTICGFYSVDIYLYDCGYGGTCLNGTKLGNSPITYFIQPDLPYAPFSSIMVGQKISMATAGKISSVAIFARDQFKNRFLDLKQISNFGLKDWILEIDNGLCGRSSGRFVKCLNGRFSGGSNGLISAFYNITLAGTYRINVYMLVSSFMLTGTPFNITLSPGIASSRSLILSNYKMFSRAGSPTTVGIQSIDDFGNLRGSGGDLIAVHTQRWNATNMTQIDYQNGTYDILIVITRSGSFQVHVLINFIELIQSPIQIEVQPGLPDAWNSKVLYSATQATAGNLIFFMAIAWDRYSNQLEKGGDIFEASCVKNATETSYQTRNASEITVKGTVVDLNNGSYLGSCIMTASGVYSVFVSTMQSGQRLLLHDSPFTVKIFPDNPTVLYSVASGNSVTLATAGMFSTFSILGRDQFGNPTVENANYNYNLRVLRTSNVEEVQTKCWEPSVQFNSTCQSYPLLINEKNLVLMNFSVTRSGNFTLALYVSGINAQIWSSPLLVRSSVTNITNSDAFGSAFSLGTVGQTMEFFIRTRDDFGNLRDSKGAEFQVVMSDGNSTIVNTSSIDLQNGRHAVSYMATKAGSYHITVTYSIFSLMNSPQLVVLYPGRSDITQFVAYGQGVCFGLVTTENVFYIQSKDKYGNNRSQGGDNISISLTGGWIKSLDGVIFDEAKSFGTLVYMSFGSYRIGYYVTRSGNFSMSIKSVWLGGMVMILQRSPFNVLVTPGPMTASTSVLIVAYGSGLSSDIVTLSPLQGQNATAGNQDNFIIQAKDQFRNPLTSGGDEQSINVTMLFDMNPSNPNASVNSLSCLVTNRDLNQPIWKQSGQYLVTYPATIAGSYRVITLFKGSPLSGSGHRLTLFPAATEARMCTAEFPVVENNGISVYRFCTAGVPSTFVIISKDRFDNTRTIGGENKLSVFFTLNNSSSLAESLNYSRPISQVCEISCITDLGNGRYTLSITPTVTGTYFVRVLLNSSLVCQDGCSSPQKSPFVLFAIANEVYAPSCTASGTGLESFAAGAMVTFQIQAKDLFGNNRTFGRYLNGKYAGEFFQSNIALQGQLINRKLCTCDLGICTFCNAVVCNTISLCPKFSASPNIFGEIDASRNNGRYNFQYAITRAGTYSMSITKLYRGQLLHIAGSPFDLNVYAASTSPAASTALGDGLVNSVAGSIAEFVLVTADRFGNLRSTGQDIVTIIIQHITKCEELGIYSGVKECSLCTEEDTICTSLKITPGFPKPVTASSNINDLGNGSYVVRFIPTISGLYKINVMLNHSDIGSLSATRSPFFMQCSPTLLDAAASTISAADGSSDLIFSVSMISTLILWPRDKYSNNLADSRIKLQISLCDAMSLCTGRAGRSYVQVSLYNIATSKTYHVHELYSTSVGMSNLDPSTSLQATIQPVSDGSYTISFHVQDIGVYRVDVKLMDPYRENALTAIYGSPLNMTVVPVDNTPDPAYCRFVTISPIAFSAGDDFVGQLQVKNKFNALLQNVADNQAHLEFSRNNPSDVSSNLVNQQNGSFNLQFSITVSGLYAFQILVITSNGNWADVRGSPVTCQVQPAALDVGNSLWQVFDGNLPAKVGTSAETIVAGQALLLHVMYRDRFKNHISAPGMIGSVVPTVLLIKSDASVGPDLTPNVNSISFDSKIGVFLVNFVTSNGSPSITKVGKYTLSVQVSGFNVINSPSIITVLPSYPDPGSYFAFVSGQQILTAGQERSILIQSKDRFGNNRTEGADVFSANIVSVQDSGMASGIMLVTRTVYQGGGLSQVLISIVRTGNYTVHIRSYTIDVFNSPIYVIVVPSYASAGHSRNATEVPNSCIAGTSAFFEIQAVDTYGNLQTKGGEIFEVLIRGIVLLRTFDSDGKACAVSESLQSACVVIHDLENGRYNVTFVPFKSGYYVVEAYLHDAFGNSEQIGQNPGSGSTSPWARCKNCNTLQVLPNVVDIRSSVYVGAGMATTAAGEEATFTILAKDKYGNDQVSGGGKFVIELHYSDTGRRVTGVLQDLCGLQGKRCGNYFVAYSLTISGNYQMLISTKTNVTDIDQMIISIVCFPSPLASAETSGLVYSPSGSSDCSKECPARDKCCLLGEGASYGIVGKDMTFLIQARDRFGNSMSMGGDSFSIFVQGPSLGESTIVDYNQSPGMYLAQYVVYVPGIYSLFVKLRGVHVGVMYDDSGQSNVTTVKGSPFTNLEVSKPGTGLEELKILAFQSAVVADSSVSIRISATDPAALRTLRRNSGGENSPVLAASMTWVDSLFDMMDSSLFESNSYPNKVKILNSDFQYLETNKTFQLFLKFTLSGNYKLSISSGNYMIHLSGSPFPIEVFPGTANVSQTYIAGSWQTAVYGQDSVIFITTRDSYGNDRSRCTERRIDEKYCQDTIRWAVAAIGSAAPPDFVLSSACVFGSQCDLWQGQYSITPVYPAVGVYCLTIQVMIGNQYVTYTTRSKGTCDSLQVKVVSDSEIGQTSTQSLAYGNGLHGIIAGQAAVFRIVSRDEKSNRIRFGGNNFAVSFRDTVQGNVIQSNLSETDNGLYLANQIITRSSVFSVAIVLQRTGLHVVSSPFTLFVVPEEPRASTSHADGSASWLQNNGLISGMASEHSAFTVQLRDKYGNDVKQITSENILDVKISRRSVLIDNVVISHSYCTDSSKFNFIECYSRTCGTPPCWHDRDGSYKVVYSSSVAGEYWINISFSSNSGISPQPVYGSVFRRLVSSSQVSETKSYAIGLGLKLMTAGSQGSFTLVVRDRFGNVMDAVTHPMVNITCIFPPSDERKWNGNWISSFEYSSTPTLTAAGQYQIWILLNNMSMAGAPFSLNVLPAETDYRSCTAVGSSLSYAVAGMVSYFVIVAKDSFSNRRTTGGEIFKVSASAMTARGLSGNIIQGTVYDNTNGTYLATINVSLPGKYSVLISLDADEVLRNTLECVPGEVDSVSSYLQSYIPQQMKLSGRAQDPLGLGLIVSIGVQARDKFGSKSPLCDNALTALISRISADTGRKYEESASGQNRSVDCEHGLYRTIFHVSMAGEYSMSISLYQKGIFQSPFQFRVSAGTVTADRCTASEIGSSVQAGVTQTFVIQSRDQYGNIVRYDPFTPMNRFGAFLQLLVSPSCGEGGSSDSNASICVRADVIDNMDSSYLVYYTPTFSGKYELVVYLVSKAAEALNYLPIARSPFLLEVQPGTLSISNIYATIPIAKSLTVGSIVTFDLEARDKFGNSICSGVSMTVCADRRGSGLALRSLISWYPAATSITPSKKLVNVNDRLNGIYQVSYQMTFSANYSLDISVNEWRIKGSPFKFHLAPSSLDTTESTVEGSGTSGGFTGHYATFVVVARDRYGNQLTSGGSQWAVDIFTPSDLASGLQVASLSPNPLDRGDGTYFVEYQTTETGNHLLRVQGYLGSNPMLVRDGYNQFVRFAVDDGFSSPSQSVSSGQGVVGGRAGVELSFTLQLRSIDGLNRPKGGLLVTASLVKPEDTSLFVNDPISIDNGDGTYSLKYTCTAAGVYKLSVMLSGDQTQGSPFRINILPAPTSYVTSRTSRLFPSSAGNIVKFQIQAFDHLGNLQEYDEYKGPDSFSATLQHNTLRFVLIPEIFDNRDGSYVCSYTATVAGVYTLRLYLASVAFKVVENIVVTPSTISASKCTVDMKDAYMLPAGAAGFVRVIANDVYGNIVSDGSGKFNGTIIGSNVVVALGLAVSCDAVCMSSPVCPCSDLSIGTYGFRIQLYKSGEYNLFISLSGELVLGKAVPVVIDAGPVSTINSTISGCEDQCASTVCISGVCQSCTCSILSSIGAGLPTSIFVQSRDMYGNRVPGGAKAFQYYVTTATQSANSQVMCTEVECPPRTISRGFAADMTNGLYKIDLNVVQAGIYFLVITRNARSVEGSPFVLRVVPGQASYLPTGCYFSVDSEISAGQPQTISIFSRDAHGNQLTTGGEVFSVFIAGQGISTEGTAVNNNDGSYHAFFSLNIAGSYRCEVTLSAMKIYPYTQVVTVTPSVLDSKFSTVYGSGLDPVQSVGMPTTNYLPPQITVIGRDSFRNIYNSDDAFFAVNLKGPVNITRNSSSSDFLTYSGCGYGCGQYIIRNSLTVTGNYYLDILFYPRDKMGMLLAPHHLLQVYPLHILVINGKTVASSCFAIGLGSSSCATDKTCDFFIQAADAFGNHVSNPGDSFEAKIVSTLNPSFWISPAIRTFSDDNQINPYGLYNVSYQVTSSGLYVLRITLYGAYIRNMPGQLKVSAGEINAASCTAEGMGVLAALLGDQNEVSFVITARDRYGNAVLYGSESNMMSSDFACSSACRLLVESDPYIVTRIPVFEYVGIAPDYTIVYRFRYSIPAASSQHPSTLFLNISLSKISIKGSPFSVSVRATPEIRTVSTRAVISCPGIVFPNGATSQDCDIARYAELIDPGDCLISGCSAGEESYLIIRTRDITGRYIATGRKFVAKICKRSDCPSVHTLCALECSSSVMNITDSPEFRCCVSNQANQVKVAFVTKTLMSSRDDYQLDIRLLADYADSNVPISGSPFQVTLVPSDMSFEKSTLIVLSSSPLKVGVNVNFMLTLRDQYGNQRQYDADVFQSLRTNSSGPSQAELTIQDKGDGSFVFILSATKSGRYFVSVSVIDRPDQIRSISLDLIALSLTVPACTATFFSGPDQSVAAGNDILTEAGSGLDLVVQSRDKYGNIASSDVLVDQQFYLSVLNSISVMKRSSDGFFRYSLAVTASGLYSVSIHGTQGVCFEHECPQILKSPFNVYVNAGLVDPSMCNFVGSGVAFGIANTWTTLSIIARDRFGNKVQNLQENEKFVVYLTGRADVTSANLYLYHPEGTRKIVFKGDVGSSVENGYVSVKYKIYMPGVYSMKGYLGNIDIGPKNTAQLKCSIYNPCPQIVHAASPSVQSCTFSDSAGHIYIEFDKDTNRAGLQSVFSCSELFVDETTLALSADNSSTCSFINAAKLDIVLGYGATISVNDDLKWKSGILHLKQLCLLSFESCFGYSLPIEGVARVGRPSQPVKAVAILKAPFLVGPCDGILLDASFSYGSSGRPMQYNFGLEPGSKNDAIIRNFIDQHLRPPYSQNKLLIPRNLLMNGESYTFVASITNFLDESNLDSATVYAHVDNVPLVTIEGPKTIVVQTTQSFRLRGNAQMPSCLSSLDTALEFSWELISTSPESILSHSFALDPVTRNARTLFVKAESLLPGVNYTFQLTAAMSYNTTLFASASTVVSCKFGGLLATIKGGNRAISVFDTISLDASNSIDFDGSQASSSFGFQFQWACKTSSGGICFEDFEGIIPGANEILTIPPGRIVAGTYIFSVIISKEPGPRRSTAYSTMYVFPNNQSYVSIDSLIALKINSKDRIVLNGKIEAGCKAAWIQTEGDNVLQYPGLLSTPLNLTSIAFLPNTLYPGSFYRFRLVSACVTSTGFAEIAISTNTLPSSGIFTVDPSAGYASLDSFTLSMSGWVDDAEDLPFRYEFRYYYSDYSKEQIPLGLVDINWMEVYLPSPENYTTRPFHNMTLVGIVIDSFDGQAQVDSIVKILSSPSNDNVIYSQTTAARLKRFIATENVEGIIQMVISLSNYQNLTCEARDSLVIIIQRTAPKVAMKATDVAGFASSLRALLKSNCLQLSEHRILSDDNIFNALNLTNYLILNSQVAGLDPTAQFGFSESLSQALDLISSKNFIRRRLIQAILNSDFHGAERILSDNLLHVPIVRRSTQNENPGEAFILAATNFATSQLVGALPGEDARVIRAKSMDMISARRLGQEFSGKAFGGERTFFELPKEFLYEVGPVNAYFLSLKGSPFFTDYEVNYVTSLSFENQRITALDAPIIIHLQASRLTSESICPFNITSQGTPKAVSECEDILLEHCRFWNGSGWDGTGCIVDEIDIVGRKLKCHCYHLTEFASVPFDSILTFDYIIPIMQSAQTARLPTIQIVVVSIVCSSLLLYLIMCYWGWRRDIEDHIKSNTRNRVPGNSSGIVVESALPKRSLEPEEENAIFSSKNSKLLKRAFKEKYVISLMIVKSKILLQFTSEHKLFGCFKSPKNHYTRPRRITVLFCTVQGIMMINSIFCGDDGNTIVQKLVGGILASLIVLPISIFFRSMFYYLDVDDLTRKRWDTELAEKSSKAKTEVSKNLHSGPTAGGVASPPQNLKEAGAPSKIVRGYIPRPDQIQMFGSRGLKSVFAGRFKRKVKFNTANQQDHLQDNTINRTNLLDKRPEDVVVEDEILPELSIPRRALPIHSAAKPPAPSVFFPISEDGSVEEDKQEIVLGNSAPVAGRVSSGKAMFQSKVAKAVVSTLVKSDQKKRSTLIHSRFKYAAYLMAFLWYTTCSYICVLYGLKFTAEIERVWGIAICISFIQDLFINELIMICLVTAFKLFMLPNLVEFLAGRLSENR